MMIDGTFFLDGLLSFAVSNVLILCVMNGRVLRVTFNTLKMI